MPEIDREFLRTLAEWSANGAPVASLYVDVDGRKFPRKQDMLARAQALTHELQRQAQGLSRSAEASVGQDVQRILEHLGGMDRGTTRGVAVFACSEAGLWEAVELPRPVPDLARLGEHPYVLRLEALAETYESFCTALVDREKARIFLARMGQIQDRTDILDDVPGQHDQGGWSQSRYRRHVEDHAYHHLKHVADELLRFWKTRGFEHLILAGPHEAVTELERLLHDYLRQRVIERITLPMTAGAAEVLDLQ